MLGCHGDHALLNGENLNNQGSNLIYYNNIRFKKILSKDILKIYKWRNEKSIRMNMLNSKKISYKEHLKWSRNLTKDKKNYSYIICYKNKDLGLASIKQIDNLNQTCTWGYYIAEKSFRYLAPLVEIKLISIIFEKKGIRKIWGQTIARNKAIMRIHKYLGFKIEGILRNHVKINNNYENVILTSLFKEDWKLIKNRLKKKLIK